MNIQRVLSKFFSTESVFSIHKKTIGFVFLDFDVYVSDDCVIVISDMNIETRIEFCEIKDIEITDDMVKFILQDGGYEHKSGDVFYVSR